MEKPPVLTKIEIRTNILVLPQRESLETQISPPLQNVNLAVKNLFPQELIPGLPVSGGVKFYLENWKVLSHDPQYLE